MKYLKLLALLLVSAGIVNFSFAGPVGKPEIPPPKNKKFDPDRFKPNRFNPGHTTPNLKLKPNLVVRTIAWRGEFCNMSKCYQELKKLRINKATCAIYVRIMNTGLRNAGPFRVSLRYTRWDGTPVTKVKLVSGLLKGGMAKSKLVTFTNIGYYRINKPFIAKVDSANQIAETNEGDNVRMRVFNH
jgi:hypothetical protein